MKLHARMPRIIYRCTPGDAEITPIIELLRKRQPFLRVRPSDIQIPARDNA